MKLADYVALYNPNLWWKDERDPARTVAVRAISISFHSIGGEMRSCPIGLKLADFVAQYKPALWWKDEHNPAKNWYGKVIHFKIMG